MNTQNFAKRGTAMEGEKSYHWSLKIGSDNKLYFESCDELFINIYNVENPHKGALIDDILPIDLVEYSYETMSHLACNSDFMLMYREINGKFWSIEVQFATPLVSITGTCAGDFFAIDDITEIKDVNKEMYQTRLKDTILIEKDKNGDFVIDSVSENMEKMLDLYKGEKIDKASDHLYALKTTSILTSCLNYGYAARVLDIYRSNDRLFTDYLMLTFIPMSNHEPQKILIAIHSLDKDMFCRIQKENQASFVNEFSEVSVAMGIFLAENDGSYKPECINNHLYRVAPTAQEREALCHDVLEHCIQSHSEYSGTTLFNNSTYYAVGIPNTKGDRVYLFLSLQSDLSVSMKEQFGTLSNRENQIARMLVNGATIKYISFTLNIADGTVKKTISNIYRKLGVASRVELIRMVFSV